MEEWFGFLFLVLILLFRLLLGGKKKKQTPSPPILKKSPPVKYAEPELPVFVEIKKEQPPSPEVQKKKVIPARQLLKKAKSQKELFILSEIFRATHF